MDTGIAFEDSDGDRVVMDLSGSDFCFKMEPGYGAFCVGRERAKYLAYILMHFAETGELREPVDEKSVEDSWRAAQESRVSELQSQIAELKASINQCCETGIEVVDGNVALKEHVRAIDQRLKSLEEDHPKIIDCLRALGVFAGWETGNLSDSSKVRDDCTAWLQKKGDGKWGLWWVKDERWVIYNGGIYKAKSKKAAEDLKRSFCNPEGIEAYPYPADGGKPMELREPEQKTSQRWGLWREDGQQGWLKFSNTIVGWSSYEIADRYRRNHENPQAWTPRVIPKDLLDESSELTEEETERPQLWGVWGISGWFKLSGTDVMFSSEKLAIDWLTMSRFVGGWEVIPYDANKKPSGSKEPKG